MNRNIVVLCLLSLSLIACAKEISQEEAVSITQNFVNSQVKFFVNEENSSEVMEQASISVLNTVKTKGVWSIYLHVEANQTGESKKANMMIKVDAKDGKILSIDKG